MQIARLVLDYLNTLIWPALLITIIIAGRSRLAGLVTKLSGIEASTSGLSATFEHSAAEATALTTSDGETSAAPSVDQLVSITPTSYVAAREIGTHLAAGNPVLLDLQDLQEADAKRLIDFCAGAAFITNGAVHKLASRRFLVHTSAVIQAANPAT